MGAFELLASAPTGAASAAAGGSHDGTGGANMSGRMHGVLIALLLAVAACTAQPPRSAAQRTADAALAANVELALMSDPRVFARHVDVEVEGGVVHLSGLAWSTSDLYAMREIAARVPGVERVDSQLELAIGGRPAR